MERSISEFGGFVLNAGWALVWCVWSEKDRRRRGEESGITSLVGRELRFRRGGLLAHETVDLNHCAWVCICSAYVPSEYVQDGRRTWKGVVMDEGESETSGKGLDGFTS
jgi:hypothetical protein